MPEEHLQDDKDVEQILKIAVRTAGFSDEEALRQRLQAAGHELGLTEAQIAVAEEKYKLEKVEKEERRQFEAKAVNEFWEHFVSYIIINAGLLGFDFFRDGSISWALWPLIGWGIAVAFHAWGTFFPGSNSYDEEFEKWRKEKNRKLRRRQKRAAEREAKDS